MKSVWPVPERGFATEEFARRLENAQRKMAASGVDGLLLMTEPEVRYFSGFLTQFWQSPTRPWFLFVPCEGKPVAVIPTIGASLMASTWIEDIRTWSSPNPEDDGITLLQDLLAPCNARHGRIGLLKGPETVLRMPLADFERLDRALPGIEFVDATVLLRSLRMVKSEAEIDKIRHICQLTSATFARANQLFAVGQPLVETFRAFRVACLQQGADEVPYLVGGADQGGYQDIISPPSPRLLQDGDILMLDTGALFDGYFCDFDRNFAIGHADPLAQRAYETLYQATTAGLDAARPGNNCRALFTAMQKVIQVFDNSAGTVGRMGHGLGMQLTEWPSHAAFDDTVLEEGMVITLEPSLNYGDGLTMVHEENIVIRDGEPEFLSRRAPASLPVIA